MALSIPKTTVRAIPLKPASRYSTGIHFQSTWNESLTPYLDDAVPLSPLFCSNLICPLWLPCCPLKTLLPQDLCTGYALTGRFLLQIISHGGTSFRSWLGCAHLTPNPTPFETFNFLYQMMATPTPHSLPTSTFFS